MNQAKILDKILMKIVGIEDKLDTFVTKDDLVNTKDQILGEVDQFIKLHKTLDQELTALRSKYHRLDDRLSVVES